MLVSVSLTSFATKFTHCSDYFMVVFDLTLKSGKYRYKKHVLKCGNYQKTLNIRKHKLKKAYFWVAAINLKETTKQ